MNPIDIYAPPHAVDDRHVLGSARQLATRLAFELERQGFVVADAMRMARATVERRMLGVPAAFINAEVSMLYAVIAAKRAVEPPGRPILFDLDFSGEPLWVEYPWASGKVVLICYDPNREVNRAARLALYVGGRWVRRAKGYVMSRSQARRVEYMWADGQDISAETGQVAILFGYIADDPINSFR